MAVRARRLPVLLLLVLLTLLGACTRPAEHGFNANQDALLRGALAHVNSLADRDAAELSDAEIVELGYLERARLGLGSPFRLAAFALRDTRLDDGSRPRLAYAILGLTLQRRGYQTASELLGAIELRGEPAGVQSAAQQLQLIETAIAPPLPDGSIEPTIRSAYDLAYAERVITRPPPGSVSLAAALLADRERARRDALDLLRHAAAERADPLELLLAWRAERRFRVERPALAREAERASGAEVARAGRLARELRALALRLRTEPGAARVAGPARAGDGGWLGPGAAARLLEISAVHDYPTQAPVAIAVASGVERLGSAIPNDSARASFARAARNEERFAAALAALGEPQAGHVELTLLELRAAVYLRAWAQEVPWFPGDPAPTAREVEARFGLKRVDFDDSVPQSWRPYYLRMVARALENFRYVLPTAELNGLSLRIGALPRGVEALALHDPKARRITLPPSSGAGTLAHELGHDLDRRLGERRYGLRAAYATDVSAKSPRADRLTRKVQSLAAAFGAPGSADGAPHATRAAETFARGVDWFVAVQMAREGRSASYLSSFQDAAITGYGTARSPDAGADAVPALLELLDAVAPVRPEWRAWTLRSYGVGRPGAPDEIVAAFVHAGEGLGAEQRLAAIGALRDTLWQAAERASCDAAALERLRPSGAVQRALIDAAAEAAARGAVFDGVRDAARSLALADPAATASSVLDWRPVQDEPTDSLVLEVSTVADHLVAESRRVLSAPPPLAGDRFRVAGRAELCRGSPLASTPAAATAGGELALASTRRALGARPDLQARQGRRGGESGTPAAAYLPAGGGLPGGSPARR